MDHADVRDLRRADEQEAGMSGQDIVMIVTAVGTFVVFGILAWKS